MCNISAPIPLRVVKVIDSNNLFFTEPEIVFHDLVANEKIFVYMFVIHYSDMLLLTKRSTICPFVTIRYLPKANPKFWNSTASKHPRQWVCRNSLVDVTRQNQLLN